MTFTAAVLTISDKGARGERVDTSGPALAEHLTQTGYAVVYTAMIPDERALIQAELVKCADELGVDLVLTTGGTGFSSRDITPETTLAVIEREARGIPEAMRAASMRITPRGCLSRAVAGIRGGTLIVNLPGSKKAAEENLLAVLEPIHHGMEMLASGGSADCAAVPQPQVSPSMDAWLKEAKAAADAEKIGMYLVHNETVRETARAAVREGKTDAGPVRGMRFSYDAEKVEAAQAEAMALPGIFYVRVWLNRGELTLGDDIMYVLVGGDIRPHVLSALEFLVGKIKSQCVTENELI